jgi:VIT1/CCC1 family predicted Fe2+/Mn2+ transporter
MSALSEETRRNLLNAAKKIHANKQVEIMGYRALAERTGDEKINFLLKRISEDEERLAEFWSKRIRELGGSVTGRDMLRDWKVRMMMGILGTKGFFEWAVVGEEEGIQDLAIQAEKIRDASSSETWRRYASDERMHLDRIRTEVLGMEAWEIHGGSGVRDMIFGANDGLVSTLAFVAGVVGAITDPYLVLISGIAELFAGTISMAAGAYQSSKSELEVLERESQRAKVEGRTPEEERDKLAEFYQSEGYTRGEAEAIVRRLVREREAPIRPSTLEELGLAPEEIGNPVKAGVLCGVSFGLAAVVPILPFAFRALRIVDATIISVIATLATLFGVGAMKTIFSRKNWVRSGLEMMVIGACASTVTYMIGKAFSFII